MDLPTILDAVAVLLVTVGLTQARPNYMIFAMLHRIIYTTVPAHG